MELPVHALLPWPEVGGRLPHGDHLRPVDLVRVPIGHNGRRASVEDVLRAAGLPLLKLDDPEVAADLAKVKRGKKLSPVLLVQGVPLWIADGYHRVCASYHIDEKARVPCRIVARTANA